MKPRGKDAVREALLQAGTRLFASRGPALVSVRDVAAEAGVNHGLVHRHFGSKDDLLTAVMSELVREVEQELGPEQEDERLEELLMRAVPATVRQRAYWQILARSLLEGRDPAQLQASFPVVRRLLAAMRRRAPVHPAVSSEAVVAGLVAVGLGLQMFEPFLRAALGLDSPQWQQIRAELMAVLRDVRSVSA